MIDGDGKQAIILFDGWCVLCSRSYRFVSARDRNRRFRFIAMQEREGRLLASRHGISPDDPATFILLEGGRAFVRSDAALRIAGALPGWGWTRLLCLVPKKARDWVYDIIARNRYRWFGRRDACVIPCAERLP
jgi:predicted DCC family thiol-disulfide oxidoreductase YuxK